MTAGGVESLAVLESSYELNSISLQSTASALSGTMCVMIAESAKLILGTIYCQIMSRERPSGCALYAPALTLTSL